MTPTTATRPDLPAGAGSLGAVLGAAARVRGGRAIHMPGDAWQGSLVVDGGHDWGNRLLDEPGEHPVVIRISRAVGLPRGLPDAWGVAVRLPDLGQDLLLSSLAGAGPLGRHLLGFSRTLDGHRVGVLSHYRALPVGRRVHLSAVVSVTAGAAPRLELAVGKPFGPWSRLGQVTCGAPLSAGQSRTLSFDPFAAGAGLVPDSWAHRVSEPAYRLSRRWTGR